MCWVIGLGVIALLVIVVIVFADPIPPDHYRGPY